MSYFVCPNCGKKHEIFGKGNSEQLAQKFHIPVTARLPLNPDIATAADRGGIEGLSLAELGPVLDYVQKVKK